MDGKTRQRSDFQLTLPSDREIRLTRTFNAPRDLVWIATTDARHVRRWWSCEEFELTVCEIDLRIGGRFRFTMQGPDGIAHPITGVYREIVRPQRVIHTQVYDVAPYADREAIVTVTFDEDNGRTRYTSTILHQTRGDRDAHVASGMETGSAAALDRLADLLPTLETTQI